MKKTNRIYFHFFLSGMSKTSIAQDWANLKKYELKNSLLPPKKAEEKRIILMGDSVTEFWSQIHPDFFKESPYINRGISGQTTPQMLIRFRPDVINLQPDIVIILAGVNDIAGNTGPTTVEKIMGNLISMVELAITNKINVILCTVLPASNFYWRPNPKAAETIIQLNKLIQLYAQQHQIPLIDYHTAMADRNNGLQKELSDDGVHPNIKGYQTMEPLLKNTLQKTLKIN